MKIEFNNFFIKMENLLIIGSKKYKINISNILNKFNRNIRINFSFPDGNNGEKIDIIVLCLHMYDRFYIKKYDTNQIIKAYSNTMKECDTVYIEKLVKIIKDKNYTQIILGCNTRKPSFFNQILNKLGIKFQLKKILRVGIATVLEYHNKNNVFLYGFSINSNNTNIYGCPNYGQSCHNFENEYVILKELHKKKIIDLTFCLLEDSFEPILNCSELYPTNHCIKLLMDEFNTISLKGELFDKDFISSSYNFEKINDLTILTNKNE